MRIKSISSVFGSVLVATSLTCSVVWAANVASQENSRAWRASKMVGVPIYGADHKKLGAIADVIIGRDGRSQLVVIAVGGVLGVAAKDVAIPYDNVRFSDEPAAANGAALSGTEPPVDPDAFASDTATYEAASTVKSSALRGEYPDHGTIAMTADQLQAAPAFAFAN